MRNFILLIAFIAPFYNLAQHELIDRVCYNSDGDDYCVREVNGRNYFISDKPDSAGIRLKDKTTDHWFTDIYEQNECGRQEARLIKNSLGQNVSINSSWYDGPISYSKKDSVLFFSNTSEGFVHGKMGIYWSRGLADGSFTDPKAFPLNSSEYSCMHPYFDESSSLLYFSSDLGKDSTGFNLYRIRFNGAAFLDLDTLTNLNSERNELFPYVNDEVIYFSSDRNGGYGGLDIYCNADQKVEPLDYPFNSEFDDFAISFTSSNRGYFASNREEGMDDDIYEFYIPSTKTTPLANVEINPVITKLETLLREAEPNSTEALILQAAIDKLREQEKAIAELKQQMLEQQERMMDYADTASYLTFDERINLYQSVVEGKVLTQQTSDQSELPEAIAESVEEARNIQQKAETIVASEDAFVAQKLVPFLEEQPLEIGHINEIVDHYDIDDATVAEIMSTTYPFEFYFAFDHFDLTEEQLTEVRMFMEAVKGYNGTITIMGHTDNIGADAYNLRLSKSRANYIAKLLIKHGFDKERLVIIGKGESLPKYSNLTKEGRKRNRRVVVSL